MNYPSDFDVASFKSAKTFALSRVIAIWTSIVFVLILCACVCIVICRRYKSNFPLLISRDPITPEWHIITYPNKQYEVKIEEYQIIQEALVKNYVYNWFTTKNIEQLNADCDDEQCNNPEQYKHRNRRCFLYCGADEKLFEQFKMNVLPDYIERAKYTDYWKAKKMLITSSNVTEKSGVWQVYTTVESSFLGKFDVLVFIETARDEAHIATLGYYVKDFNAYRMTLGYKNYYE